MEIAVIGGVQGWAVTARSLGFRTLAKPLDDGEAILMDERGVETVADYPAFFERLDFPRLYLLDLPCGAVVDEVVDSAYVTMEPGDLVVDLTPSYWGDTLRRWRRMRHRSIFYIDAAKLGGDLMVSGDGRGLDLAMPRLQRLLDGHAVLNVGGAGAAHYAAMVQDSLLVACAQARNEAVQLLEAYPGDMDPPPVRTRLRCDGAAGGRADWAAEDALRLQAVIPLLAQAAMQQMADALDAQQLYPASPRLGPFVRPDDLG